MERYKNYHRAFGVYGICVQQGKLLVIDKNGGPYINRFDLPGGSLEEGESLVSALHREFEEETGASIHVKNLIGTSDFFVKWDWEPYTHVHHIAVFYHIDVIGELDQNPTQFEGQDSTGVRWISQNQMSEETSSPLVLKAMKWMFSNEFNFNAEVYNNWIVKK
ncbi:NUDIX hydrolase [Pontibacillus marinus]|uniref:DNA mismatch repair protein MutT n=1 Tax=Pontibacillus marinus BH030004 = DSM 16465 TaxID=1385511 RepID=A0A0A5HNK9_9BACI|nr:NUDIX hydrolase [Pontibacillus marinus]KGX85227.1 DNA mismatch repair protein MutT [Pontibacillus marinus BH030004 = DSM 16465]